MAIKLVDGSYACSVCGVKYPNPVAADGCRESHQLLYIPMSKTELNRLMYALINEDFDTVPRHLWDTLQKYAKKAVTDGAQSKVSDM